MLSGAIIAVIVLLVIHKFVGHLETEVLLKGLKYHIFHAVVICANKFKMTPHFSATSVMMIVFAIDEEGEYCRSLWICDSDESVHGFVKMKHSAKQFIRDAT